MDEGLLPLEQMLGLEQRFFLTDHNLNYTDKMSMAVGVEVRVPFLDYDLLEISAKIPTANFMPLVGQAHKAPHMKRWSHIGKPKEGPGGALSPRGQP